MRGLGNSRNDARKPRLPKCPEKHAQQMRIREFAKNNGFSITTARIMLEGETEESGCKVRECRDGIVCKYQEHCSEYKKFISA